MSVAVWNLIGFQLTPVHKRENVELVLSRMKQFHTKNILAALLKRSLSLLLSAVAIAVLSGVISVT